LKETGTYLEDEHDSLLEKWYENGNRAEVLSFVKGKEEGQALLWYPDGKLKAYSSYRNGKLDSLYIEYYLNGRKKCEMTYRKGRLNGASVSWYESGVKQMECMYESDKRNGKLCAFYPNGKRQHEIWYRDGEMDGSYTEFYFNGRKKAQRSFEQGLPAGQYIEWDEQGKISSSGLSEQAPDELGEAAERSWFDGAEMPRDTFDVYIYADLMPVFPGGVEALNEYILKHLKHPEAEGEKDLEGSVVLSFIVEKNGSLSDLKIIKSIHHIDSFDQSALALVGSMPAWIPGKIRNKPVRVQCSLPVAFTKDK
jgi:protein TonB